LAPFSARPQTPKLTVEPHTFKTAVPSWRAGDVIPLPHRSLRVVEVRDDDADRMPTLIVEDVAD
jgi:hypothetical protein